ncbi:TonB-dependent receptor domain-containing protein [Mesonia ostreae]|uniref:Outer membrane beta-barrel family protein n=1 Tax=Mesonia ostreae TaxID=861110 RepID=A0ABU2KJ11_9FLAO|nr:outer membrane beta-barrel family protein [Mesonia ostreae]MDT0294710.1 outer membrane beta-barrel family protein [Mesonia ostreae]
MKSKLPPLLFFLIVYPFISHAQYDIRGTVQDEQKSPIGYCNISLHEAKDSVFVKGAVTGDDGSFALTAVKEGDYILKASFVGYKSLMLPVKINDHKSLKTLLLKEDLARLEGVRISTKKPRIIKEVDKLIFEVENTSLSSGNTWDILNKTPGVINVGGDLKIRNTSATIYINDKKVYLTSAELNQLLNGLSAENIKQIEVIRNPSAKYDAGDGPILNIVTTTTLTPGYKGSLNGSYTQAVKPKYNLGTSHYYKTEKLNVFANYSYTNAKRFKEDEGYINFINTQNEVFERWRSNLDKDTQEQQHNLNFIADYEFDAKNKLSLNGTTLFTPQKDFSNRENTRIFDVNKVLDSSFNTTSELKNEFLNTAVDLTYVHVFNKENTQLSVNAHSTYYKKNNKQRLFTRYFNEQDMLLAENKFSTKGDQKINIYAGQADFETLFDTYQFSTGIKYASINSSSSLNFYDVETFAPTFENNDLNDDFRYQEKISSAYASIAKDWEKWSAKAGLRLEHTNREGESITLAEITTRDYTHFFPSLYLSYQAAKNHSLGFDYGRKIARPSYSSLNPFKYFINENNFQTGNPNLEAALSHSFNLNYTYKDAYSFDIYFHDNGENVTQLVFQDNENQFLRNVHGNMLESKSYGIDFFHGRSLRNWWYAQVILSGFHEEETFLALESSNVEVTNEINGFYASFYNGLTLSKDGTFTGDVTFLYISSLLQGSYQMNDMLNLSLGVRKSFWEKRAELSLHLADVFNSYATQLNSTYLNQDNGFFAHPENRYVRLGFKYHFGNFRLKDNQRTIKNEERGRL